MKTTLKKALIAGVAAGTATSVAAQDATLTVWGDPVREPFYQAFDDSRDDVSLEFVSVARNEICLLYTSPSPRDS